MDRSSFVESVPRRDGIPHSSKSSECVCDLVKGQRCLCESNGNFAEKSVADIPRGGTVLGVTASMCIDEEAKPGTLHEMFGSPHTSLTSRHLGVRNPEASKEGCDLITSQRKVSALSGLLHFPCL